MVAAPVDDVADVALAPVMRPPEADDLEALTELDRRYSSAHGLEPNVNRGSLHYFGRSGHSFVAHVPRGEIVGFVLAHSTWTGGHPSLRLERLVAAPSAAAPQVAAALAEAVVKSAYDAGVYRLGANVPAADAIARSALERAGFETSDVVAYARRLGSAGAGRTAT